MVGLCVCRPFSSQLLSGAYNASIGFAYDANQDQNSRLSPLESQFAMDICDFNNSYMTWVVEPNPDDQRTPGHMLIRNSARIQLDARCEILNEEDGTSEEFFLITPCRTEWMYRSDTLFQYPSGEYCAIWSESEFLNVGYGITDNKVKHTAFLIEDRFTDFNFTIRTHPVIQALVNSEQIIQSTKANKALIGRTTIWNEVKSIRAIIEYPIKTINVNHDHGLFQVDTGPLPFPDLTCSSECSIEWFSVAFVCYNAFDIAEFILRKPTPVMDDGRELCKVVTYSDIRRVPAQNNIYCTAAAARNF